MTAAQDLDRSISIRRTVGGTPNGLNEIVGGAEQTAFTVRASRRDVSDGERFAAGADGSFLQARFVVRSTVKTRSIQPSDRLLHGGRIWNVKGLKERDEGRRRFLEITATVDADG
jgi:head-tail adaptor